MVMTRDYFNTHAELTLTFRTDTGINCYQYTSPASADFIAKCMEFEQNCVYVGKEFSTPQKDRYVGKFLNRVLYNQLHNDIYTSKTFEEVLEIALDKELNIFV